MLTFFRVGESEEKVREIFRSAVQSAPSVLFIDSIDVIAGKKDVRYLYEQECFFYAYVHPIHS